jgi:hypothetical protein
VRGLPKRVVGESSPHKLPGVGVAPVGECKLGCRLTGIEDKAREPLAMLST